jgi:hypothetical protein
MYVRVLIRIQIQSLGPIGALPRVPAPPCASLRPGSSCLRAPAASLGRPAHVAGQVAVPGGAALPGSIEHVVLAGGRPRPRAGEQQLLRSAANATLLLVVADTPGPRAASPGAHATVLVPLALVPAALVHIRLLLLLPLLLLLLLLTTGIIVVRLCDHVAGRAAGPAGSTSRRGLGLGLPLLLPATPRVPPAGLLRGALRWPFCGMALRVGQVGVRQSRFLPLAVLLLVAGLKLRLLLRPALVGPVAAVGGGPPGARVLLSGSIEGL